MSSDFSQLPNAARLARVGVIGPAKIGKTHWAMMAAEAGFNVLYLDGDVSMGTLTKLSPAAQKRMFYMNCKDTMHTPRFNRILARLVTKNKVIWDFDAQRFWDSSMGEVDETHRYWEITLGAMTSNDVIVCDSYSTYVRAIQWEWALENEMEISECTVPELRPMYQKTALQATAMLSSLTHAPCHVIVIFHADEYEKLANPRGVKVGNVKEKDKTILFSMTTPLSTSKPHGMQIAKNFEDVLWMEVDAMRERVIDARPDQNRQGSGSVWNDKRPTSEYSLPNLLKQLGVTPDLDKPIGGIRFFEPGEFKWEPVGNVPLVPPKGKADIGSGKGLSALINKEK